MKIIKMIIFSLLSIWLLFNISISNADFTVWDKKPVLIELLDLTLENKKQTAFMVDNLPYGNNTYKIDDLRTLREKEIDIIYYNDMCKFNITVNTNITDYKSLYKIEVASFQWKWEENECIVNIDNSLINDITYKTNRELDYKKEISLNNVSYLGYIWFLFVWIILSIYLLISYNNKKKNFIK